MEPYDSLDSCSEIPLLRDYRSRMEIRLRPYVSASTDHAPGPNSARPDAMADASSDAQNSSCREKAIQSSRSATSAPAIGVQRPANRRTPTAAAIIGG